ncbi:TetR/AcrR family transcriptional regulator [Nocardioides insulae]|uniref:TetR/AcrR family transcriptional regulator n=1 Tax=Nocardioides insulae TaxID=394734 RepID=UPI0004206ADC|nr:TetR/AcrR family transcriptional regulator [Nocardioides insulae]
MAASARDRLVRAAFDLFAGQGFEQTTVDQIASHAGVGRTTFFRHFPTKESVVFPDHDAILGAVDGRLVAAGPMTAAIALHEAARIVLRHYLDEGDLARERYRLTRTVRSLRDAEIAGQRRYQRLFQRHIRAWTDTLGHPDDLLAEVLANAVVTAHNHVLRGWLQGAAKDPETALEDAVLDLTGRLWRGGTPSPPSTRHGEAREVVVLRTTRELEDLIPDLERLLGE